MIKTAWKIVILCCALAVILPRSWLSEAYSSASAFWMPSTTEVVRQGFVAGDLRFTTERIERKRLISTVSATGSLAPVALVSVSSQVSGQVKEIYADFNAEVKRDEAIALIDPVTFQIAVDQAQADLDVAEASVTMQEANIDRMVADLQTVHFDLESARANSEYARIRADDAAGDDRRKQALTVAGSAADRDHAHAAYLAAEAQFRSAKAAEQSKASVVTSGEAQLRSAQALLVNLHGVVRQKQATLRQMQIDLDRTVIRAPVDGTVIVRNVEVGQTVAVSLQAPTLFTIAQDLRAMQINTAISEAEIGHIRIGQRVEFTVDAYAGRTFTGDVIQIRQQPQTTQNVVTYTVVATVPNPELLLIPGMTATTSIIVEDTEPVLAVSNVALRFRPPGESRTEESRVFVKKDGSIVAVPLQLGTTDGNYTAIIGTELPEGEEVITGLARRAPTPSETERRVLGVL